MKKPLRLPLTRARSRLFELADLVREGGDDTAVVLEQRGHAEGIVMVREARLKYLEDRVSQMEHAAQKPFTVAGSLTPTIGDEELAALLKALRHAWAPANDPGTGR